MALPLDTSGAALTNKVVDEIHTVSTLEQRYIIPNKGTFFVNKLKVANNSNGQLLEPVIDYMVLQLSIDASNDTLKEASQIIYIKNPEVISVALSYQAVGSARYEDIHTRVRAYITDFINGNVSNKIFNAVAGEAMELLPRDYLSTPHEQNTGAMIYTQLSNIAEAISAGDPSAVQAVYEFLINYTANERSKYTSKLAEIRNRIDSIFKSTEIVNGQYLFTHEDLNPFVYLNYGNWVSNPNMLFWGGPELNPVFGDMKNVSNAPGLLGIKTMAYRRDDSAPSIVYTLTADKTQVNEGDSVTFTLTAPGIASGTRLNYVISGVKSADIVGGALNGTFVLNASSTASVTITLVEDQITDGDMNLILRLVSAPDVFTYVKVNDSSQEIKYEVYFSSDEAGVRVIQSVDEGSSAFLQIRTAGLITDRTLFLLYNDSTVNDDDMLPRQSSVLVSNNRATVPYYFKNDFVTEGNETLTVNLCTTQNINTRLVRTSLQVNDTSKTPTLTSYFTNASGSSDVILSINEGLLLFLKIKTTNMPDGSIVNLTYGGTATSDDFTSSLPTSVSLINNEAIVQFNVKADGATEGDEVFTITSALDINNAIKDTKSVTINDTSVGYMLDTAYYSNNSEGTQAITGTAIPSNVYLCIKTRGFNNGDKLRVDFSSSDSNVKDILTALTADVTVNNNYGYVYIALNDAKGTYTAVGQLRASIKILVNNAVGNQIGSIINFTVNPRAIPTAKLTAIDTNSAPITQVNEGVTFKVKIETTNLSNGLDALPVTYSGTATASDFTTNLPSSVVITNGVGWLEFTTKADSTLEGTETFIVTLQLPYNGGTSSVQVNILDTSLPVVNARWTSDNIGNNSISNINEGQTAYLQLRTSGFVDGTVLQLVFSGQATSADFTSMPNTATIVSGSAVVPFTVANDYVLEGSEIFTVSVNYQGTSLNSSASILINDTSLPGPTELKWSRYSDPTLAAGSLVFNEGDKVYLHIATRNLSNNTELVMTYNGTATSEDFDGGLPSVVSVTGAWTTVPLTILVDIAEEAGANEYLFATATSGTVAATTPSSISIIDSSSHILAKNGEVKEVTLLPGAKYLLVVQGGGGSGGRALATNQTPTAGNGNRGTLSKATFMDGTTELFNIFGFGGGRGQACAYGLVQSDSNGYINECGGYSLVQSVVSTIDGISTSSFIPSASESFCFPGMTSGYVPFIFYAGEDFSSGPGFNHSRGFKLPVSSVTNTLWDTYGGGGKSTKDEYGNTGLGGAAGGTYIGLITNPTKRAITLKLTAGVGGVTDNTTANGGVGFSGGPGQPGCVLITRVASNYSLRTQNSAALSMAANSYTAQQVSTLSGSNYTGNKIVIPSGKRFTGTLAASITDVTNIPTNDFTAGYGIVVLQAENKVYWAANQNNSNPACFVYASYYPATGGAMLSAMDDGGVLKRLFKNAIPKCGSIGLAKGTTYVPYTQGIGVPSEYANLVVDYPDGDARRMKNGGQPDYGTLAHQFNYTFTADNPLGRAPFWPAGSKYLCGTPRIHLEVANTTAYDIVIGAHVTNSSYLKATLFYNLENI